MGAGRAIIVAARRTPIGRIGGALRCLRVEDLAAPLLTAVLADAGLTAEAVDDVILGNAAGPGGNPARLAALTAGLPVRVPGVTVDRQCGSGLEAINLAARLVEAGAGEVYLAGGVESTSTAPWRLERPTSLYRSPRLYDRARFAPDSIGDPGMGEAAETVARRYHISRARQDAFALASHRKSVAAQRQGRFDAEILPLPAGPDGAMVAADECPRPDTSPAALAALSPAFVPGGTVTAGNACPVNDGAAVVAVVSEARFRALGHARGLRVVDSAAAGVDPNVLGIGPVAAVPRLLARHPGLTMADIDAVEFNEAFAAQVLASLDRLGIPEDKVNRDGGAIALGHPFGASGAVLVVRLFTRLVRRPDPAETGRIGLATLGIAGGLGIASLFETVEADAG
ncbi:MAG: thiolase family protein [Rhodospirillales bacterium]|nr:MAG: thiolase family protein [Rhodospirillales bacterium]